MKPCRTPAVTIRRAVGPFWRTSGLGPWLTTSTHLPSAGAPHPPMSLGYPQPGWPSTLPHPPPPSSSLERDSGTALQQTSTPHSSSWPGQCSGPRWNLLRKPWPRTPQGGTTGWLTGWPRPTPTQIRAPPTCRTQHGWRTGDRRPPSTRHKDEAALPVSVHWDWTFRPTMAYPAPPCHTTAARHILGGPSGTASHGPELTSAVPWWSGSA
mmetsp:Transcript_145403/g.253758  ORF Transcript_145403/g.253758 Transcript_145403/m.253758 type:complete len:210 (-) Transcript_145403:962-1591(-)